MSWATSETCAPVYKLTKLNKRTSVRRLKVSQLWTRKRFLKNVHSVLPFLTMNRMTYRFNLEENHRHQGWMKRLITLVICYLQVSHLAVKILFLRLLSTFTKGRQWSNCSHGHYFFGNRSLFAKENNKQWITSLCTMCSGRSTEVDHTPRDREVVGLNWFQFFNYCYLLIHAFLNRSLNYGRVHLKGV